LRADRRGLLDYCNAAPARAVIVSNARQTQRSHRPAPIRLITLGQALRSWVAGRRDRPEASAHGIGTGRPRNVTISSLALLWPSHGFDLPVPGLGRGLDRPNVGCRGPANAGAG
jgi:hypothetical protein